MKKLAIILLLSFLFITELIGADNTTSNISPKKKIFVTKLTNKTQTNAQNYEFYSTSLARSISTTLSRTHDAKFIDSNISDADLLKQGYTFKISGEYNVTGQAMTVNFTVTLIEKGLIVVVANISGFSDVRVFELVDKISGNVSTAVLKPIPAEIQTATVIDINKEGKITTREEVLSNSDLRNRNFSRRDLSGKDLSNSNFSGANFSGANLSSANLQGSNFSRTNMSGANMQNSNAARADFSGADMNSAKLRGAQLSGAKFNNTILTNSDVTTSSPEFNNAVINNAVFDKRKMFLGLSVNLGLNFYDRSAYAINPYYSSVTGNRTNFAKAVTLDFMYFFSENFGIKFSAGWRELETKIDEYGYDTFPTIGTINIDMKNKASHLTFDLSGVVRIKSLLFYAGFYTGVLLNFSGYMYAEYAVDAGVLPASFDADKTFSNKTLFGISIGAGFTLRLSSTFSLLFTINANFDLTKWYSDTATNNFTYYEATSNTQSQLKNLKQTSILFRLSILWGLK